MDCQALGAVVLYWLTVFQECRDMDVSGSRVKKLANGFQVSRDLDVWIQTTTRAKMHYI